jgi:hypothetical protein
MYGLLLLRLLEALPPPSPTKLVRRRPEAAEGAEAAEEAAEAAEAAVEAVEAVGAGLAPAEAAEAADTPTKCKPFRETLREVLPSNA